MTSPDPAHSAGFFLTPATPANETVRHFRDTGHAPNPRTLDSAAPMPILSVGMKARRILLKVFCFLLGIALMGPLGHLFAQDAVTDALKQLSSENVRGYVQPIIDGFGANLNSGLYHSPRLSEGGFHARIEIIGSGMLITDRERSYFATPPAPFDQEPVRTATILGGLGSTLTGPGGVEYQFQNGQIRADLFGLGTPQLTVGNFFGTEAIVRYAVVPSVKDFPRSSLVGYGGRHSISQYIPGLPFEATVGAFWQTLKVGDIISVSARNVSLMVGTSVALFTVYGGVQHESTVIDVNYTYTGYGSTPDSKVSLHYTTDDVIRWTTGFGMNLIGVGLYTDIGFGKVTVLTGTVGIGF
jgi:hypothetical protein